jgi:hypothetical protein
MRNDPAIEELLDDAAIADAPAEIRMPAEKSVPESTPLSPARQPAIAPEDEDSISTRRSPTSFR